MAVDEKILFSPYMLEQKYSPHMKAKQMQFLITIAHFLAIHLKELLL